MRPRRFARFASVLALLALVCFAPSVERAAVPFGFFKASPLAGCSAAAQSALADWVSRVQGQGSDVTGAGVQVAVCAYIDGLMTDGVWSKLFRHNIYVGDGLNALKAPLKNGGPTATDNLVNFVGGDYTQATGLTGDGSTKYVNTGLAPNNGAFGDNDIAFACYVRTASNAAGGVMASDETSMGKYTDLLVSWSGTSYWDCNDASNGRTSGTDANGTGLYVGSRTSTSSSLLYKNATAITPNATGSGGSGRSSLAIFVHAVNDNGTPNNYTSRTLELYAVSTGLTATDVTNFTARYVTLRTALGR